jgi:Sulfotransferase family
LKKIWPNFFLVGAHKTGTTSLYFYLKQHPQVFLPALKEPHYFSRFRPYSEMLYPHPRVSDEATYLRLFSKAAGHKAVGEASSSYLCDEGAAERIHQAAPHAKIVIMLRDPVARAYSQYLMDAREGWQDRPFYEALLEDWNRPEKGWGVSHMYVEPGLYRDQVKRYLQRFGPEQVLVLPFSDLRTPQGRRKMLGELISFLELDPAYLDRIDTSQVENEFAVARWNWSRRVAASWWARRLAMMLVPAQAGSVFLVKMRIYDRFFLRRAVKPPMDPRARDWLQSMYEDDVAGLERLLGRNLPELRASWLQIEPASVASASRSLSAAPFE